MAEFEKALKVVLQNEGVYDNDSDDPGGETVCGRDRKHNPDSAIWPIIDMYHSRGYKSKKDMERLILDDKEILAIVGQDYRHDWDKYRLSDIQSQSVATNIFDCIINPGSSAAIQVQKIVGVKPDGDFGNITIGAINAAAPKSVIESLKNWRIAYYKARPEYLNGKPFKIKYLSGWLSRAEDTANV